MLEMPEAIRTTSVWDKPGIVDRFREKILSGKSMAESARELSSEHNVTITRNACVGKADRIGLKAPPVVPKPKKPKKPVAARRWRQLNPSRSRAMRIVERKKTFSELFGVLADGLKDLPADQSPFACSIEHLIDDTSQCRWPVTTPDGQPQLFCADQTVPGFPYCTRHCHRAYYRRPA
jgi:hypothetical protein